MPPIELRAKVQTITYEHQDGSLKREYATSEKRISLAEAAEILEYRTVQFKEVLKVKYEYIVLHMSTDQLDGFIQE